MSVQQKYTISCGVREFTQVSTLTTEDFLAEVLREERASDYCWNFLVFSDTIGGYYNPDFKGQAKVNFIRQANLGKVIETDEVLNRAHGPHKIKVWVWEVDWDALKAYLKETNHV